MHNTFPSLDKFDTCRCGGCHRERRSRRPNRRRHYLSSKTSTRKADHFESGLNALVQANERYRTIVDYCLYRLIHKPQRKGDDEAAKMQKRRKTFVVHIKNKKFKENDSNSMIIFLIELKTEYDSSRLLHEAAAWHYRKFMTGHALAFRKTPLILSSTDASRPKSFIK